MTFVMKAMSVIYPYSTHDDFIRDGLVGMGYSRRLYKMIIPNPKISKEKQISLFFSMFIGIFVYFQKKKIGTIVSFKFHTHVYM